MPVKSIQFKKALAPLVLLVVFASSTGCMKNFFEETAQKNTDAALLYRARVQITDGNYTAAIESISQMSTAAKENHETKALKASAYAGRCGMDLIMLAGDLGDMATTGKTLFQALFDAMSTADAAAIADCQAAETELMGITSRSSDENILLAFVEFAKIGAILNEIGDADDDNLIDGTFDTTICNDAGTLTSTLVAHVGTGITIAASSLAGTTIGGTAATSIGSLCTMIEGTLGMAGFCSQTSASDFTDENPGGELYALRGLIRANELGVKTCNNTTDNCLCPP